MQSFNVHQLIFALVVSGVCYALLTMLFNMMKLRHIPTVGGSSLPVLSFYGAVKSLRHTSAFLQEGYIKYKGGVFKYATPTRWKVIVTSERMIEELRKASEEDFSLIDAAYEILQIKYTLGVEPHDEYGHGVIRSQLTRNLANVFAEMHDEIRASFAAALPATGKEWTAFHVMSIVLDVVSRTSSRVFVGSSLCHNADYIELIKRFTMDYYKSATIIRVFPDIFKPLAGKLIGLVPRDINRAVELLGPLISERLKMQKEFESDIQKKPDDMLQWLIDAAPTEYQRTVRGLVRRVLTFNNAALHTSSITFAQVLVHLASDPQYIQQLREEVEPIIRTEGWSKSSLDNMRKVDSFIRESIRVDGLGPASMVRIAMRDYTFSDGTFVPAGTFVSASARAIHYDENNYRDAGVFKPFRFAERRDEEGTVGTVSKQQLVTTSTQFLPWGHGKQACPGRFFAALELKTMLAHFVLEYDLKTGEHEASAAQLGKAQLLLRKRQ